MPSSLEIPPDSSADATTARQKEVALASDLDRNEPRNLLVPAMYQVIVRIGWIFKTETIIIPAFLDAIGGGPILRGLLPVLNKFGMSIPPVVVSGALKKSPQKKRALFASTLAMSVPFFALALLWYLEILRAFDGSRSNWFPFLFLLLYGLFFCFTGVAQLASNTLQGKLIRPNRRGRLLAIAMALGTPAAILAAWYFLDDWLLHPAEGYGYIFAFSGSAFALAAFIVLLLAEPDAAHPDPGKHPKEHFVEAWRVLRTDADFRRLLVVTSLFSIVIMIFPHYQAMGISRFHFTSRQLLPWILIQNVGVGTFSLLAGPAADRWGNRLVLRVSLFASMAPPLLATVLTSINPAAGERWFWLVFLAMGTMPVVHKILSNYTLEISEPADHPRYISTLGLCLAVPIMIGSPLVGLAVSLVGFQPVCLFGAAMIALGGFYSFRLREPRHALPAEFEEVAPDNLFELDE